MKEKRESMFLCQGLEFLAGFDAVETNLLRSQVSCTVWEPENHKCLWMDVAESGFVSLDFKGDFIYFGSLQE